MELYKINLNTDAVHRAELVSYSLERSVLGVGWGYHYFTDKPPRTFDDYYSGAERRWSRSKLTAVRAFQTAPVGSLVWFRDLQGTYYLSELTGEWRLFDDPLAGRLDLGSVRDVRYALVGSEARVPGDVLRTYTLPHQRAFFRVASGPALAYSRILASKLLGTEAPSELPSTLEVLAALLSPLDVEDLVAAFLQDRRDYIALPARHSKSTAVYEYVLRHRTTGEIAAVQVKTGGRGIPVETLSARTVDRWFVYTEVQQELPDFVERITAEDLASYMESGAPSLPPVIELWMNSAP